MPESVRQWTARAQIYCMPSVRAAGSDSKELRTALIEAMSSGLSVVATTHAGIPEVVAHGSTGLLAPKRGTATLAQHLITLVTDSDARARMGSAGRERVLEHFDHREQAGELAGIYDKVRDERRWRATQS
jgi:glycosyltransferase involved in cell wall biosynthesis